MSILRNKNGMDMKEMGLIERKLVRRERIKLTQKIRQKRKEDNRDREDRFEPKGDI